MGGWEWGGKGSYERLAKSYTYRGIYQELGRGQVQEENNSHSQGFTPWDLKSVKVVPEPENSLSVLENGEFFK